VRRNHFPGGRELVRQQATQTALEMLRRGLLSLPPL
jgi:nicotinamide mononucleotide (NMN) deamidase PncC